MVSVLASFTFVFCGSFGHIYFVVYFVDGLADLVCVHVQRCLSMFCCGQPLYLACAQDCLVGTRPRCCGYCLVSLLRYQQNLSGSIADC